MQFPNPSAVADPASFTRDRHRRGCCLPEGTRCLPPRAPSRRGPPGVLIQGVGTGTRRLTAADAPPTAEHAPLWRPADKVYGDYLIPYLHGIDPARQADAPPAGVEVDETLPGPGHGEG